MSEPFDRTETDDDDIGPMQMTDWEEQWKKANFAQVKLRIENGKLRGLLKEWIDGPAGDDLLERTREALK